MAASLACHLVAVTLLASGRPQPDIVATLDEAIRVFPDTTAETALPVEVRPPATPPASPSLAPPRINRTRTARAPSPRPIRLSRRPTPPVAIAQPAGTFTGMHTATATGTTIAALPARPPQVVVQVPAGVARSLRVYDTFPRMPETLRLQQRAESVDVQICVSDKGTVHHVRLRGASPTLETELRAALLTWRYRPLILQGTPTPFCHALRLTYR